MLLSSKFIINTEDYLTWRTSLLNSFEAFWVDGAGGPCSQRKLSGNISRNNI